MNAGPIVVAIGGNALAEINRQDSDCLPDLCKSLAEFTGEGLLITHGNGPQIGSLAMAQQQLDSHEQETLDTLGAETEGLLGYRIEQELSSQVMDATELASVLTMVEVSDSDPAFRNPGKPVGNLMSADEADHLMKQHGWQFTRIQDQYRRVVPSPAPRRILQIKAISTLVSVGIVTICAGGGGIPVIRDQAGRFQGVDAVVDKDYTSAILALAVDARLLVIATNVDGVYRDWDGNRQDKVRESDPDSLSALDLPEGSMGPKVRAACDFVKARRKPAVIGALADMPALLREEAGTHITLGENA